MSDRSHKALALEASAASATIGIDGCRGGWVWIGELGEGWRGGVVRELKALLPLLARTRLTLIDMPIGLLEGGAMERQCDREARALLGRPRGSSVFRAPCRPALAALDQGYTAACAINREITGVGLSLQTYNIMHKIRELDALLQRQPDLCEGLRESHPEVCLLGLNRGQPMSFNKRSAGGQRERCGLLQHSIRDAGLLPIDAIIEALLSRVPRRQLAIDDVVDAAILAVTAQHIIGRGRQRQLPSPAPRDARGLPMTILMPTS